MEALERTNWVDLLALIVILRISYVGSFLGIAKQLLPLLSLLIIFSISVSYYDNIAIWITQRSALSKSVSEFFVFVIIIVIFSVIFKIILRYIPIKRPEALAAIERVGGALLGLIRATVILGIILALFILAPVEGFEESVKGSLSGNFIMKVNLDFYTRIANTVRIKKDEYTDITTVGVLKQLTKEKDYKFRLFDFNLKDKARFFKNEEL